MIHYDIIVVNGKCRE